MDAGGTTRNEGTAFTLGSSYIEVNHAGWFEVWCQFAFNNRGTDARPAPGVRLRLYDSGSGERTWVGSVGASAYIRGRQTGSDNVWQYVAKSSHCPQVARYSTNQEMRRFSYWQR